MELQFDGMLLDLSKSGIQLYFQSVVAENDDHPPSSVWWLTIFSKSVMGSYSLKVVDY
jgi:hypothetical protein